MAIVSFLGQLTRMSSTTSKTEHKTNQPEANGNTPQEDPKPGDSQLLSISRSLLNTAAVVVIVAGLKAATLIVVPLLVATFIAIIVLPIYSGLRQRKVPSVIALAVIFAFIGGFLASIVLVVSNAVGDLAERTPEYVDRMTTEIDGTLDWVRAQGIDLDDFKARDSFQPQSLTGMLGGIARSLAETLTMTFIVIVVMIFILLEIDAMTEKIKAAPNFSLSKWEKLIQILCDIRRYMSLKTVMSLLTGALVTLWLVILDIDYPLTWGILAFALNYIPNIGSTVAAVPAILLAWVDFGMGWAFVTAIGYVAINVGVSNGVEPRVLGHGLGLSPLVVLLSMFVWGWILGAAGMLLCVPLTMTLKIIFEGFKETRGIAILMGPAIARPAA